MEVSICSDFAPLGFDSAEGEVRGCRHEQSQVGVWADRAVPRLAAHALFYANRRPAILFFRDWFQLSALEEGESVSVHSDVIRLVIAVLVPLVLVTTG